MEGRETAAVDSHPAASANWEIFAGGLIMVGVLAVLDAGPIARPELVWSCAPFLFFVLLAMVDLTPRLALGFFACCLLGAVFHADLRYLGLAYPLAVMLPLQWIYRRVTRDSV